MERAEAGHGRFWPETAIGFAENHANRIAALRAEAELHFLQLPIAASDPKRSLMLSQRDWLQPAR